MLSSGGGSPPKSPVFLRQHSIAVSVTNEATGAYWAPKDHINVNEVFSCEGAQDVSDSVKVKNCMSLFESVNRSIVAASAKGKSKVKLVLCGQSSSALGSTALLIMDFHCTSAPAGQPVDRRPYQRKLLKSQTSMLLKLIRECGYQVTTRYSWNRWCKILSISWKPDHEALSVRWSAYEQRAISQVKALKFEM